MGHKEAREEQALREQPTLRMYLRRNSVTLYANLRDQRNWDGEMAQVGKCFHYKQEDLRPEFDPQNQHEKQD